MQREATEMIRGMETYEAPPAGCGGTVELDSDSAHAWQLDNESSILADDSCFEPYPATGRNGRPAKITP